METTTDGIWSKNGIKNGVSRYALICKSNIPNHYFTSSVKKEEATKEMPRTKGRIITKVQKFRMAKKRLKVHSEQTSSIHFITRQAH